ncbi:GTP-binding protein [Paenibacillus sp. sptzw28]|uniref:CobW family GTP-binding protein n=1 Tax=Paenibacillus sp. sptzw28 TaxID=715179 RepID=UPI001C6F0DED|nr:GTP-binding protein [Paenibacillus sp. sptzw28]QYR19583.1 GTP-binding protein [Paenibacillus sp. sptzw28]
MRTPVIVLSGFLGSGKTTLLLRLLEETGNRRLQAGVLMNELGKYDVDGLFLNEHGGTAIEKLLDGCVCCSKKSELAGSLSALLQRKPDVIFIELTGVANPEEIADALTEPSLLGRMRLKQIITVLDAENALDYNSIFESDKQLVRTLRRQLEVADLIIVNKTDLVRATHLQKIEKVIHKQNERATIAYTSHSRVDLGPVLDGIVRNDDPKRVSVQRIRSAKAAKLAQAAPAAAWHEYRQEHEDHSHEAHGSFSRVRTLALPWSETTAVSQERVERFLHQWKDRLLRAKGYMFFPDKGRTYLMQHAGKRTYWDTVSYSGPSYIVMIGIELDEERLLSEWNRLI